MSLYFSKLICGVKDNLRGHTYFESSLRGHSPSPSTTTTTTTITAKTTITTIYRKKYDIIISIVNCQQYKTVNNNAKSHPILYYIIRVPIPKYSEIGCICIYPVPMTK